MKGLPVAYLDLFEENRTHVDGHSEQKEKEERNYDQASANAQTL